LIRRKTWVAFIVLTIMILLFGLNGCQTVVTDETSTASPVVPVVTEGPSGVPHEMEGHEDCIKCHLSEDEATFVSEEHHCNKCHEMAVPFPFDHGDPNEACIACHLRTPSVP
jgi:hypothetical protein